MIEVGGKTYRNLPEQVEENADQIENLKAIISEFGNVMRYKGSVDTYADLPVDGNQVGDVWNVLDTGNNYAWDGEAWDEISSIVDLTGYALKINIAPIYDADAGVYAVGDVAFHEDTLYQCNTAVLTPEAFDPAKWDAISVVSYIQSIVTTINTALSGKANDADVVHLTGDETISGSKSLPNLILRRQDDTNSTVFSFNADNKVYSGQQFYMTGELLINNLRMNGNIVPYNGEGNIRNLGAVNNRFYDLHLRNNAYIGISLNLGTSGIMKYENGAFTVNDDFTPAVTDNYDLGSSTVAWRHLYLSGAINPNSDGYGLKAPSTAGWTADKTIATLDDIPTPIGWTSLDMSHVTNVAASTVTTGVYLVGITLDTDLSAVAKTVSVKANNGIIYPAFIGPSYLQVFCNTNISIGGIDSIYYI